LTSYSAGSTTGPEPWAKMAIYNLLAKFTIEVKIAEHRQNDITQKITLYFFKIQNCEIMLNCKAKTSKNYFKVFTSKTLG